MQIDEEQLLGIQTFLHHHFAIRNELFLTMKSAGNRTGWRIDKAFPVRWPLMTSTRSSIVFAPISSKSWAMVVSGGDNRNRMCALLGQAASDYAGMVPQLINHFLYLFPCSVCYIWVIVDHT